MPRSLTDLPERPRRSLRDVLPLDDHSVRPVRSPDIRPQPEPETAELPPAPPIMPPRPLAPRRAPHRNRRWWILALVVVILVVGFGLSWVWSGVLVRVTPLGTTVTLNDTVEALRDQNGPGLSYTIIATTTTATKEVAASGVRQEETKATGQITIFNNFDKNPQTLVATTRFQTADGKIFRTPTQVVVPGKRIENGQTVPGHVTIMVVADQPGAEYNIGASDFTIPGFKGTPRYEKFSARSTGPMTGGRRGTVPVIADALLASTRTALEAEVKDRLTKLVDDLTPTTTLRLSEPRYDYVLLTKSGTTEGTGLVEVTGTVAVAGVDRTALGRALASRQGLQGAGGTPETRGEPVITNLENLTITPATTGTSTFGGPSLGIVVEGEGRAVWQFNTAELTKRLAEAGAARYQEILGEFPAIEKAEIVFRPPWIRRFPEDPSRITVELLPPAARATP